MPPKSPRLAEEVVARFVKWIDAGAPAPTGAAVTAMVAPGFDDARGHWAFQPVARPEPLAVNDPSWVKTPVDAFVLAKLEERGWPPAPDASRSDWLRRVTFDLTGLPPTPEEVEAFDRDASPNAFECGGRPPACEPPLRRAMGAALARRGAVRRDRGVRIRPSHPRRLAVPRLRDRLLEPRQAVQPVRRRTDRRGRDRARRPGGPDGVGVPPARPGPTKRRQPRHRPLPQRGADRAHRHHRHRLPRTDGRLCPLPQPQARTDQPEGLLPLTGLPRCDR